MCIASSRLHDHMNKKIGCCLLPILLFLFAWQDFGQTRKIRDKRVAECKRDLQNVELIEVKPLLCWTDYRMFMCTKQPSNVFRPD